MGLARVSPRDGGGHARVGRMPLVAPVRPRGVAHAPRPGRCAAQAAWRAASRSWPGRGRAASGRCWVWSVRLPVRGSAILGGMPPARFRAYEAARDEGAALALWEACLGDRWPVEPTAFRRVLAGGEHVVAELDGRLIGFVATHAREAWAGLQLLLVDPAHRRRGLGRA